MKSMKPVYTTAKVADLKPHPKNPRKHGEAEMKALADSIDRFGFTCPIVIQKSTGLVLAGHARLEALRKRGDAEAPVIELDVNDQDATAYMIADNQLTILGAWDFPALEGLVEDLKGADYDGMGFIEELNLPMFTNDPNEEYQGMPEYNSEDKTAFRSISVHFKDQKAVDDFGKKIGTKLTEKTRFIWFPEIEIEKYIDKEFK